MGEERITVAQGQEAASLCKLSVSASHKNPIILFIHATMTFDLTLKWSISVQLTESQEACEIASLFAQSLSGTGAVFYERSVLCPTLSHQNYNSQGE